MRASALLLAALTALIALPACVEHGAMPTMPEPAAQDVSWLRLYPPVSAQGLRAVWGMDATDMWAVGNQGTILHHDGRRLRSFPAPTTGDLTAIAGLGSDDVWAVSERGEILRWRGRSWSLAHALQDAMLHAICVTGAGEILVGGARLVNDSWRTAIWRFDGRSWLPMPIQDNPTGPVGHLWDAGPGLPVMAATITDLYRLHDQAWLRSSTRTCVMGADRDLVLYEDWHFRLRQGIIRPDGGIDADCFIMRNPGARLLVRSWKLLSVDHRSVLSVTNCLVDTLHTTSYTIGGLSVPVRPGPSGRSFFVFGQDAGLTRLTWQDNHTIVATDLTPGPSARLIDQIAGDGHRLLTVDWQGRLLAREDGDWRIIPAPWPVVALASLDDGVCLARNHDQQMALLEPTGEWSLLPDCPAPFQSLWLDSRRQARAMAFNHVGRVWDLWGLESGSWALLDTLSYAYGLVEQVAGFAHDDLYVLTSKNEVRWLLHHDGSRWREVFGEIAPEREITIQRIAAGALSGRLYLEGTDAQFGAFGGYLHEGVISVLGNQPVDWDELVEAGAGQTFCRAGSTLYALGPEGWRAVPKPDDADIRRLWARGDQGLFVITDRDEIFHHNLTWGEP